MGGGGGGDAQLYDEGEDAAMADEYDEDLADAEEQMEQDQAAHISARMSKKILQQVHAQQKEELEGEGVEEEKNGSVRRTVAADE